MMGRGGRGVVFAGLLLTGLAGTASGQASWYRGNLHVHTDRSDGASPPTEVVEWYRSRGYDFVALTDHDVLSVTPELLERFHQPGAFLLISGEEVTDRVGRRPVHLNGIDLRRVVRPQGGADVPAAIRADAAAIESAGGLAVLNHPNGLLRAALTADEIREGGVTHFEVCCSDYLGGSGKPSTEEIWDDVLTAGHRLFGIAADDAHDFSAASPDPGSEWVMVRSDDLSVAAIMDALRSGDFYATTGVTLSDVRTTARGLCLRIAEYEDYGYRTEFIGYGGAVLATDETETPCHEVTEPNGYLRARVLRSDGAMAWSQPVWFDTAG